MSALLACRRRIRPVVAGWLTGRTWPAARVTWAWSSASAAAAFATARTGTALAGAAGAAGAASAALCHNDLRRRVIPAPAKTTPGAHLLAHNCVPTCAPNLSNTSVRRARKRATQGSPGYFLSQCCELFFCDRRTDNRAPTQILIVQLPTLIAPVTFSGHANSFGLNRILGFGCRALLPMRGQNKPDL